MADIGFLNDPKKIEKFILNSTTEKMNLRFLKHCEEGLLPNWEPLKTFAKAIYSLGYLDGARDTADLTRDICEFYVLCKETDDGKRSKSNAKNGGASRSTKRKKNKCDTSAEDKSQDEALV